jgi:hypothetical protein
MEVLAPYEDVGNEIATTADKGEIMTTRRGVGVWCANASFLTIGEMSCNRPLAPYLSLRTIDIRYSCEGEKKREQR